MDIDNKFKIFIKEICSNCQKEECNRGIVVVRIKEDELQMKCCEYVPKEANENKQIEVIRYFRDKYLREDRSR